MDGLPSTHYAFDERAFGPVDPATSSGDVWVANDGGYVVRYVVTTDGESAFLGKGVTGRLTMDYELTSVDQPVAVSVPADCPPGLVDAPLPPDATDVVSQPGQLTFSTATTTPDAIAFYQQQLVASGWQLDGDPLTDETQSQSLLSFSRGDETLTAIVTVTETGSDVTLVVSRGQP